MLRLHIYRFSVSSKLKRNRTNVSENYKSNLNILLQDGKWKSGEALKRRRNSSINWSLYDPIFSQDFIKSNYKSKRDRFLSKNPELSKLRLFLSHKRNYPDIPFPGQCQFFHRPK